MDPLVVTVVLLGLVLFVLVWSGLSERRSSSRPAPILTKISFQRGEISRQKQQAIIERLKGAKREPLAPDTFASTKCEHGHDLCLVDDSYCLDPLHARSAYRIICFDCGEVYLTHTNFVA